MRLSEIAEYIVENNPKCCMAYNNTVDKGCRDGWYEEYLIEPLMDYYMFEELGLCGCGVPEETYEAIRLYLQIRKDWYEDKIEYVEVNRRYLTDLHIDDADELQSGILQFMMYVLDDRGFTDHGGSIGGCWLTDAGERLLTVLNAWHEDRTKEGE